MLSVADKLNPIKTWWGAGAWLGTQLGVPALQSGRKPASQPVNQTNSQTSSQTNSQAPIQYSQPTFSQGTITKQLPALNIWIVKRSFMIDELSFNPCLSRCKMAEILTLKRFNYHNYKEHLLQYFCLLQ